MKLAIITSRYPNVNNPYNHMFVHVRAKYFLSQGIDLTVFVPSKTEQEVSYEGIRVMSSPAKKIISQLDGFDVINLHLLNFFPFVEDGGLKIYKYLIQAKKPIALGIHGSDVFKYPEYLFDFKFTPQGIAKYLYKNFWNFPHIRNFVREINNWDNTAIAFPSHWMKNYTANHFGVNFRNAKVIANGIDTDLFAFKNLFSNRFKLLTIRPFEPKYGVDQAIEVMRHLPEHFTLDIYGKGKDKALYESMIHQYQLSDRVKIIEKFIDRKEMNALFHQYGMFFALTLFDSQGVSMCEAMASGLLTISNPVTAIPEFVHEDKTGLLAMNSEEIAQKILKASEDETLFTQLTTNARHFMETLHWHKTGQRELDMLRSLVR